MKKTKDSEIQALAEEVLQSGVMPITFDYQEVKFFQKETSLARTTLILNSLDLGTLTHNEYRFVARRTKEGNMLVQRHIDKLVRVLHAISEKAPQVECFTLPVYARLLKDGALANMLFNAFTLYPEASPSKLCVEISSDILFEDTEDAAKRLAEIRAMGVKVAISEVGDQFCPVFRLAELPFDYVLLDKYCTASLDREDIDRVAGSLVKYLHCLNTVVIAPDLVNDDQVQGAKSIECNGYSIAQPVYEEETPIEEDETEAEAEAELPVEEAPDITEEEETAGEEEELDK